MSLSDSTMLDMNEVVGRCDILFLTFDALRFDVAQQCLREGHTPNLANLMGGKDWEERHSPGNFTYAAHQAFFAGFLPTPVSNKLQPRLFALRFAGSETTTAKSCVFDTPDIVSGLAADGYRTICIGGVGFFNKESPLGNSLPGLFQESYWRREFGVTERHSTENQIACALEILKQVPASQRLFLFINISAIHQPNRIFMDEAKADTLASHAASLSYVDRCLPPLFEAMRQRAEIFCIVCSDHGTAYGEDGYYGHRLSHPVVWTVPYTEFLLSQKS